MMPWVLVFFVSLIGSLLATWVILKTDSIHKLVTHDHEAIGVQKFHKRSVPRIGGLAFLFGLIAGGTFHGLQEDDVLYLAKWAGVAALPVFIGGFFEDITKSISPRDRLLLAFLSAAIAYYQFGAELKGIDWQWFDQTIMPYPGVSLLLTIVMVGGLAHAANIIDGFNGLLLGVSILALIVFMFVASLVGDTLLTIYMSIMLGALVGLFVFNFPKGRIFTGDGGAYLIGFLLAVISLLLVKSNDNISPWFPLMVLIYPVFEVLFSICRKKLVKGIPAMRPDTLHLHMLIYSNVLPKLKRLSRWNQNSATSIVVWIFSGIGMIPAVIWWNNTQALLISIIVWCLSYIGLYALVSRKDNKEEN